MRLIKLYTYTALCLFSLVTLHAQNPVKVSGRKVVVPPGQPFMLRGVNIGGWLVTENWMCGITDTSDAKGHAALKTLQKRFGDSLANTLMNTWRDNWITASDLDTIKALGFNLLRVPFGWYNLQDSAQHWLLDSAGHIDFRRFDWIVNEAAKRNLYVLFDYHLWIKEDSAYNSISNIYATQMNTAAIWRAVATHFKNNATVLGYDLLNEPTGSPGDWVMHMLYDTVRAADPDHIISIEWTKPDSAWHNVIYQDHLYGLTATTLAPNQVYFNTHYVPEIHYYDSLNVPFYVGETQAYSDSSLAWSLQQYCQLDVHWSPWAYKTVNQGGWGLMSMSQNAVAVNLNTDSFNTIQSHWSQLSNAAYRYELPDIRAAWSSGADCINTSTNNITEISEPVLYPNPVTHTLSIRLPQNILYRNLIIRNILGQKILEYSTSNSVLFNIDISALAAGLYIVELQGDNTKYLTKVVKN